MQKAYKYDENGYFEGEILCQLDPLASRTADKEIYLLPGSSTLIEPPAAKKGFKVKFNADSWEYEEIIEPVQPEPSEEELKQRRINELKFKLYASDYAIIKIAEGTADKSEYADLIKQREAWRAEINELEGA